LRASTCGLRRSGLPATAELQGKRTNSIETFSTRRAKRGALNCATRLAGVQFGLRIYFRLTATVSAHPVESVCRFVDQTAEFYTF